MTPKKIALAVFIIGSAFWMFLLQNLPFTFGDDLNVIHYANQKSWTELILAFLNPLTPAFYVHGMASLGTTRALEPLLFRAIFEIAGYTPNAFWILKVLATSLTATLIFLLIRMASEKNLMAFLGALFFLTAVPIYRGVAWIADLEILAQLGTCLASFFFLKLYSGHRRRIIFLILMILSYWIGMKVKETGRIFPFIAIAFIAADQNIKIGAWLKQNILLAVTLILLTLTVIPTGQTALDERAIQATSHFNLANLKNVLWANPLNEHVPSDLVHTFGWILSILALIFFIWICFRKWNRLLLYFLIWLGAALAGTCLGFQLIENERYLTVVLVPATCLVFSIFGLWLSLLRGWLHRILYGILAVLTLVVPIQYNFSHIIFMRNFYDATNIADWKASGLILEDRYGIEPTWQALDTFYRDSKGEFHDIRIKEWDSSIPSDPVSVKKIADKWKAAYVLSYKENLYPTLLAASDTSNGSLYTTLMPKIKRKALRKFYVYKITA